MDKQLPSDLTILIQREVREKGLCDERLKENQSLHPTVLMKDYGKSRRKAEIDVLTDPRQQEEFRQASQAALEAGVPTTNFMESPSKLRRKLSNIY